MGGSGGYSKPKKEPAPIAAPPEEAPVLKTVEAEAGAAIRKKGTSQLRIKRKQQTVGSGGTSQVGLGIGGGG